MYVKNDWPQITKCHDNDLVWEKVTDLAVSDLCQAMKGKAHFVLKGNCGFF